MKTELKPCPKCGARNPKDTGKLIVCSDDSCDWAEFSEDWNRRAMPECVARLISQARMLATVTNCSQAGRLDTLEIITDVQKYHEVES